MVSEPIAVTLLVIDALDELRIPYFIGGSMASAMHGTARSTLDTDLVVDLHIAQVALLVQRLESQFYIDDEMIREAIQYQGSFNLIHLDSMFKVDVFVTGQNRFEQMQFQRRQLQVIANDPERKVYVTTAEDIILAKLHWYRLGGDVSDRQWRDIMGVMKVQAERLDSQYLQNWAGDMHVADLLERAFRELA